MKSRAGILSPNVSRLNLLLKKAGGRNIRRLARDLAEHDVKTVPQMGWAGIKNGALLTLAEKEFDVFITVDRNLSFQQNLHKLNVAVLVLHASTY
jgi:hypothetical protein